MTDTNAINESYRHLFENNPLPMWILDVGTLRYLDANQAAICHYGYSRDEFLSMTALDIRPPDEVPIFVASIRRELNGYEERGIFTHRKKNGELIKVQITVCRYVRNTLTCDLVTAIDVTKRLVAEERLRESEERYRTLVENLGEGIGIVDLSERFVFVNPAAEYIFGTRSGQLVGHGIAEFVTAEQLSILLEHTELRRHGLSSTYEHQITRKDGSKRDLIVTATPQYGSDGKHCGNFATFRDITEMKEAERARKRAEERLAYQALNDELTNLPNRRLFADRLLQALATAERQQKSLAVIYLDVDGFKNVNDTMGHSIGDALLRLIADRLRGRVRKSDTLARLGGDEFAVIAHPLEHAEDAPFVAQELLATLSVPFMISGHEIVLTASAGISLFPENGSNAEHLVQQADAAMYSAKRSGKNRVVLFTPDLGEAMKERLELESLLRGATERGEIFLEFQPEFEIISGNITRFEALARWKSSRGVIPPSKFIAIAEESGIIIPLGAWILQHACEEAVRWQQIAQRPIEVAVNASTIQILHDSFVETVRSVLAETGLSPELLNIEMTESAMMPGFEQSAIVLQRLRELGVNIIVDDFGTGYSSLSYLPRLPINGLKIDRSFVTYLEHPEQNSIALMKSIVSLAHNLKMKVVAEGVETEEQLLVLQELGCDEMQGFLLGRPTGNVAAYLVKPATTKSLSDSAPEVPEFSKSLRAAAVPLFLADIECGA